MREETISKDHTPLVMPGNSLFGGAEGQDLDYPETPQESDENPDNASTSLEQIKSEDAS